jgi:hypothetical protein
MQFFITVLALATAAAAGPPRPGFLHDSGCAAGTFACALNPVTGMQGWQECNTQRIWQVCRVYFPGLDL